MSTLSAIPRLRYTLHSPLYCDSAILYIVRYISTPLHVTLSVYRDCAVYYTVRCTVTPLYFYATFLSSGNTNLLNDSYNYILLLRFPSEISKRYLKIVHMSKRINCIALQTFQVEKTLSSIIKLKMHYTTCYFSLKNS